MRAVGRLILGAAIVANSTLAPLRAAEQQPAAVQTEPTTPTTAPPASAVPVTPKDAAPPPSVTIIGASDAHGVLGRDVRSAADEDMGRIVDVIVDRDGHVRAAAIDFGGFLGVGSRKIVVDWNALRFGKIAKKKGSITLELTKAQVAAAPEYKEDTPIVVLGASGSLQPLQAIQ
ncbi:MULTISPECIES: PRC-barrel domain-containing protein [unclassified Bradyrhizobium]|uniref:PRC-barrel domain-containing protein n=1 Tax=unclassified Bradyrhizobium TaxID=2631580 RepID=UPI0024789784|nr:MULTISPECIES: PRC-barrel domain-containing protein [unclassified Bradyrhizobium]WGR69245.1 PRC-barrel domain-containing protein [Bradyrhizobium sp. ISRA426]WGR81300.1 PRC-barrel domain-containing protein [Bradyrhizobium sp. ISRA430]WGR84484.1 PRC-barrel domain-containing protein [Bradyrhizobium sp. ISRA432]